MHCEHCDGEQRRQSFVVAPEMGNALQAQTRWRARRWPVAGWRMWGGRSRIPVPQEIECGGGGGSAQRGWKHCLASRVPYKMQRETRVPSEARDWGLAWLVAQSSPTV